MTDELDRMKAAMAASDLRSDPGLRKRRIEAAMAAYAEEFSDASQETADAARPTPDTSSFRRRLIGRLKMHSHFPRPSLRPLMLGGGVVATALIAVSYVWVELRRDIDHPLSLSSESLSAPSPLRRLEYAEGRLYMRGRYVDDSNLAATPREAEEFRPDVRHSGSGPSRAKPDGERDALVKNEPGSLAQDAPGDLVVGGSVRERLSIEPGQRGWAMSEIPLPDMQIQRLAQSEELAAAPQSMTDGYVANKQVAPAMKMILPDPHRPIVESDTERFPDYAENQIKSTEVEPVSTFSIDVDTASYSVVRSSLMAGVMPPADAVRVEELINYFPYDYQGPDGAETPFHANVSVYPSPWKPTNRMVHIGIKGYDLTPEDRPSANLVFLIDTSGSMAADNKLPLLLKSFRLLLPSLNPEDTVSIVAYAGSAGVVLEPTEVRESRTILRSLNRLHSGGSTAGGAGLELAYSLAEENFDPEGVNRVILATDGDFNVGVSDPERLKSYVEKKRKTGVGLSVLGFGRGNYNDTLMQTLAQNGDGNAAYIDTLSEAQKVMVEETSSTLFTIAKDVKIQVEFNPATVSEYRLIGYETRALNREDFNNDKVDAGEIGAGHSVTAIYEITPVGAPGSVDPLRYGSEEEAEVVAAPSEEYGFLKMRYKLPGEDVSRLITRPITKQEVLGELRAASIEAQFATAVAGFGQLLRGGAQMGGFGYDDVIALSRSGRGADPFGYRAEFTRLVSLAQSLAGQNAIDIAPRE